MSSIGRIWTGPRHQDDTSIREQGDKKTVIKIDTGSFRNDITVNTKEYRYQSTKR